MSASPSLSVPVVFLEKWKVEGEEELQDFEVEAKRDGWEHITFLQPDTSAAKLDWSSTGELLVQCDSQILVFDFFSHLVGEKLRKVSPLMEEVPGSPLLVARLDLNSHLSDPLNYFEAPLASPITPEAPSPVLPPSFVSACSSSRSGKHPLVFATVSQPGHCISLYLSHPRPLDPRVFNLLGITEHLKKGCFSADMSVLERPRVDSSSHSFLKFLRGRGDVLLYLNYQSVVASKFLPGPLHVSEFSPAPAPWRFLSASFLNVLEGNEVITCAAALDRSVLVASSSGRVVEVRVGGEEGGELELEMEVLGEGKRGRLHITSLTAEEIIGEDGYVISLSRGQVGFEVWKVAGEFRGRTVSVWKHSPVGPSEFSFPSILRLSALSQLVVLDRTRPDLTAWQLCSPDGKEHRALPDPLWQECPLPSLISSSSEAGGLPDVHVEDIVVSPNGVLCAALVLTRFLQTRKVQAPRLQVLLRRLVGRGEDREEMGDGEEEELRREQSRRLVRRISGELRSSRLDVSDLFLLVSRPEWDLVGKAWPYEGTIRVVNRGTTTLKECASLFFSRLYVRVGEEEMEGVEESGLAQLCWALHSIFWNLVLSPLKVQEAARAVWILRALESQGVKGGISTLRLDPALLLHRDQEAMALQALTFSALGLGGGCTPDELLKKRFKCEVTGRTLSLLPSLRSYVAKDEVVKPGDTEDILYDVPACQGAFLPLFSEVTRECVLCGSMFGPSWEEGKGCIYCGQRLSRVL